MPKVKSGKSGKYLSKEDAAIANKDETYTESSRGVTLPKAVKKLQSELKKDADFYFAYQSNIAMAFLDTFDKLAPHSQPPNMYEIVNQAAVNFLNLFIDRKQGDKFTNPHRSNVEQFFDRILVKDKQGAREMWAMFNETEKATVLEKVADINELMAEIER